jgi:serine protease Do
MSNITHRNRVLALVGAAVLATPLATPIILGNDSALASALPPASVPSVSGIVAPAGSFASIVIADKPAVVTITTMMKPESVATESPSPSDGNAPFEEQFRQFFGPNGIPVPNQTPQQRQSQRAQALGSGFVISTDGYIVTNNHVIDKALYIKITLDDGTELPARLIGADAKSDLAVLKVEAKKPLSIITWGDSDTLKLGDQILAIGNPFGIGTTVTAGIVSARGRDLHSGPYDDFIQIDAPINHGNSGGPLVDHDGNVVGINTAIYSPNGGSVGVGFAIPSDQAKLIVSKLMEDGSIQHGFIGVQIQPVSDDIASAIGLAKPEGALVSHVDADTPAGKAGIETGDVITALGGNTISSPHDLSRMVADLAPGAREDLTVWRQGQLTTLHLTIGENDQDRQQASAVERKSGPAAQKVPTIGIGLADITADVRQALNLSTQEKGAVIASVAPNKPAAEAGLQPGDIIVSINQHAVQSADDAMLAVANAAKAGRKVVLLLIDRGDEQSFVTVPFSIG